MPAPRIALVVGHAPRAVGAVSVGGVAEFPFNDALAADVVRAVGELVGPGALDVRVVHRPAAGIGALVARVNALQPAFACEMHFNSHSNPQANGTEVLHWHSSPRGRALADRFQAEFRRALDLRDRGLVAIKSRAERGGTFLAGVAAPAVIAEPFFGSNPADWQRATERRSELALAYARAIVAGAGLQPRAFPQASR